MVERGPATSADLLAQARRCRSLASGLLPGEDRRRLTELATALEVEASRSGTGEPTASAGGRQMAEA